MKNPIFVSGSFVITMATALSCFAQYTPKSPYPANTTVNLTSAQVQANIQAVVAKDGSVHSVAIQPAFKLILGEPNKTQVTVDLTANNTNLQLVSEIDAPHRVQTNCFGEGLFQTYRVYLVTGRNRQLISQSTQLAENTLPYFWDATSQQWVTNPAPVSPFLDKVVAFRRSLTDANRNTPANIACEQLDAKLTTPPSPGLGTIQVSLPVTFGSTSCSGLKTGIQQDGSVFGTPYHYNDLSQTYQGTLTLNGETQIQVSGSDGETGTFRGTPAQNQTCPGN